MTRPLAGMVALLSVLLAAACGQTAPPVRPHPAQPGSPPVIYAALGASETAGVGTDDPARQSFPQDLYQRLPRSAVLYNFGIPGETTAAALNDELPPALSARPTLVTVWFNVDDMVAGVAAADYQDRLDRLVAALRQGGAAKVLIANTPRLEQLPVYAACRSPSERSVRCPLGNVTLPPPEQLDALVTAYNAAMTAVAERHEAVIVDLFGQTALLTQHPEYVSSDGFHPSAQGAAAIATAFASQAGL